MNSLDRYRSGPTLPRTSASAFPRLSSVSWTRISWPALLTLAAQAWRPGTLFLLPWYIVMFRQHRTSLVPIRPLDPVVMRSSRCRSSIVWMHVALLRQHPAQHPTRQHRSTGAACFAHPVEDCACRLSAPASRWPRSCAFVFSWNYFLFALVLSNGGHEDSDRRRPFNFVGEGSTQWGDVDGSGNAYCATSVAFWRPWLCNVGSSRVSLSEP